MPETETAVEHGSKEVGYYSVCVPNWEYVGWEFDEHLKNQFGEVAHDKGTTRRHSSKDNSHNK